MADISIVELGIYGIVELAALVLLMSSAVREVPTSRALSIVRAFFLIPGMIAAGIMASIGLNITMPTVTTNTTIIALNTSEVFIETTTQTASNILLNPVWILFHAFVFIVLLVYVISQILILMTKSE